MNDKLTTWPIKDDGVSYIGYRFADPNTASQLGTVVRQAVDMWMDAVGEPGPNTGHRLKIEEWPWKQTDHFRTCFLPFTGANPNAPPAWNRLEGVVPDTLVILMDNSLPSTATADLGYIFDDQNRAWRHSMRINVAQLSARLLPPQPLPQNHAYIITHELGHVLGLMHEHQRDDRDNFVFFNCANLEKYEEALARSRAPGSEHDIDYWCHDPNIGFQIPGFMAPQFSKQRPVSPPGWPVGWPTKGGHYDLQSIMHYNSYSGKKANTNPLDPMAMPLTYWTWWGVYASRWPVRTPETGWDIRPIFPNFKVPHGDTAAIIELYPWTRGQSSGGRSRAWRRAMASFTAELDELKLHSWNPTTFTSASGEVAVGSTDGNGA